MTISVLAALDRRAVERLFKGLGSAVALGAICGIVGWAAAHWINQTFDRHYDAQSAGQETAGTVAVLGMVGVFLYLSVHR